MAKVYSWEVSVNPYKYAYIVHPNDTKSAYVGEELKGNNLQKVIDWVAECSDEDYIEHFNMVKELCKENNYSVKFENVNAYMDVDASCDNLRGPAGRGIINITLTNSTELVDTYTINYTDGTNTSFVVKHGRPGDSGGSEGSGDVSVSTYFAMIYTSGRDELDQILEKVDTPTGGAYDWINYKLTPPTGWQESDSEEGNVLKPPVWMSTKTFIKGHDEEGGWSTPTMISGENGKPGVDGDGLEFIYTQIKPVEDGTKIENDKKTPGFVPPTGGWTNHPKGVDENNRTEWFTTRKYDKDNEEWGDWATPAIWSQYGVNGQDGDGVEYIYYLAGNASHPDNPTPDDYDSNDEYQQDEWTPSAQKWTDNPTGVDATNQWEWVAVRKYSGKDKKWGPFSDPSLWSKYGETGQPGANAITIRKVYKMTDSTNDVPEPPTDNSYTDWSSAFPVDYTIDKCVWCCEAEMWAHNNEFVQSPQYIRVSEEEDGSIIPPSDATTENTQQYPFYNVPNEYITSSDGKKYKYLQLRKNTGNSMEFEWGHYYEWKGGWSKPYLVTGTKGADATPMDYVTYVFYYGERNNPPTGGYINQTGITLDFVTNKLGEWCDFPNVSIGTDGDVNCWYQCCLSMYSNNTIKSWGGIHPCNGKDGNALPGKYTEFRFKVTNNGSNGPVKPTLTNTDKIAREPEGWVTTKENNFPQVNEGQTMWQIFAIINPNGNNGEVVEGEWEGPIQVSAENGKDSTVAGPAGKQGVSGIPGANFKVKYCLGTFSEKTGECYWKSDDIEPDESFDTYAEIIEYSNVPDHTGKTVRLNATSTYLSKTYYAGLYYVKGANIVEQIKGWDNDPAIRKPYGSGYFGKDPSKFNDLKSYNYWFDFPPNSEIIKFDQSGFTGTTEDGKYIDYKDQAYEGRVIRRKLGNNYVLSFIYYHEGIKAYTNQDITTTTLTLEEAENFHVYVWCVQGTETWKKQTENFEHDSNGNLTNDVNIPNGIEWGIPFKLQGTNGLNGLKGADGRSQTVYPMGVYNSNEVYLTTESKAPYVYDPNDSNFYVLNRVNQPWVGDLPGDYKLVIIHPSTANSGNTDNTKYKTAPTSKTKEFVIVTGHTESISGENISGNTFYYQWSDNGYVPVSYYKYAYNGAWITPQGETTPCQNYQNSIPNKYEPAWVKFESFEALYTSIGIIENGMIGSAVYNNEFMFSQQGIDATGNATNYASESAENGGGFLSGYEYDKSVKSWKYKGTETYISDDKVNPYEMKVTPDSTTPVHSFRPNITLNFKTGQAYLSTGEITFGNGVMTAHTGIFNNVVVNGTYNTQVLVINNKNKGEYIYNDYLLLSNVPDIVIFENLGDMTLKLPYYYPVYYYVDLFRKDAVYDKYIFNYVSKQDGILGEVPSGKESSYAEVSDYAKINVGNLCYYTDYGYKKEGGKYVINNLTDVRSYIGREIYFFNKSGGKITIECGEVFTKDVELDGFVRVSSVNYNSEWILPTIPATSDGDIDFIYKPETVGDGDKLYENYIMHAKHPAIIVSGETSEIEYKQDNVVINDGNLCIAKCDIGNYTYIKDDDKYRNNLLGWRFNMVNDDISDIYYNDSYLRTVYIYDNNNRKIDKFEIVLDWTWNTYLSSSFGSKSKFTYDDGTGYIKYKHTDGEYYLVNGNTPTDTANLNMRVIYDIDGSNNYYFSTKSLN